MCGASIFDKVHPLMIYGICSICHIQASLIITWMPVISINTRISLSHFTSFFCTTTPTRRPPQHTASAAADICRTAHLCRSSSPSSNPNRRGKLGPIVPDADFNPVVFHHPFPGSPPSRSPPLQPPPPPGRPQSETPSNF